MVSATGESPSAMQEGFLFFAYFSQKMRFASNLNIKIIAILKKKLLPLILLLLSFTSFSQTDIYDSGGPVMPEQAAYDVTFYDLNLAIYPETKSIKGELTVTCQILSPLQSLVLNLDTLLEVRHIKEVKTNNLLKFHRKTGQLWIDLGKARPAQSELSVKVSYEGIPRVAPRPPWSGGFTWSQTSSGEHWIATTCQQEGPDIWWPAKDHVSDKPDSMALHIRVPAPLVVATNGRFVSSEPHGDGSSTYHWFISTPISAYNVALNIAPYQKIETLFESVTGESFPMVFYVLPEDYEKGQKLFPEMQDHLHFFEEYFGPYPFRADKYGVAQTPHLGMEHQTIIAYGANFNNSSMTGFDSGFDALHQHELAHEWWGNLVTNTDWKDMWLHEGFGSYMQPLYAEKLNGKEAYFKYMRAMRFFNNRIAIAPRESQTAKEIYRAPIYSKGAWVLHTLRYLVGDEAFFKTLRSMAYPDPAMEKISDGQQVRFVDTQQFIDICEKESGMELDWFFDIYVRQGSLPVMRSKVEKNKLHLQWAISDNRPFPMPIDVQIGDVIKRYEIPPGGKVFKLGKTEKPVVDPKNWVLLKNEKM